MKSYFKDFSLPCKSVVNQPNRNNYKYYWYPGNIYSWYNFQFTQKPDCSKH